MNRRSFIQTTAEFPMDRTYDPPAQQLSEYFNGHHSRREFIKGATAGAVGVVVLDSIGCGGPSVSGTVKILAGGVAELLILYPNNALLSKIVKLASDFDADWVAGKFDTAKTFFENLDTTVGQIISDLGVNGSTRVKLLLASLGIAVRVIASLIAEQGQHQPLAARTARANAPQTINRINVLADDGVASRLLQSVK